MHRYVTRWMQSAFTGDEPALGGWRPPADVYQIPDGWVAKFDLAGVRPDDVQVEIGGRRLTVRGVRRDCHIRDGWSCYSMEISYSRFERSVEFPCDLDPDRVRTEFHDGMLLVWLCVGEPAP